MKQKLSSKRGASLAIGLVFFLICAMVGASVLAAATASSGSIQTKRQTHQDYLAVSSAAQLLRDEILSSEFQAVYNEGDSGMTRYSFHGASLASLMEADAKRAYAGSSVSRNFELTSDEFETVYVRYEMRGDSLEYKYDVTLVFSLGEGSQQRQAMTLTFDAVVFEQEVGDSYEIPGSDDGVIPPSTVYFTVKTTTVTWSQALLEQGARA